MNIDIASISEQKQRLFFLLLLLLIPLISTQAKVSSSTISTSPSRLFVFGQYQKQKQQKRCRNRLILNRQHSSIKNGLGHACNDCHNRVSCFVLRDDTSNMIRYHRKNKNFSTQYLPEYYQGQGHQHHHNHPNRHRSSTSLCMKIRIGLVGLPNVGKSTLFNVLAQRSLAKAENFPFCTIDPNTAPIPIPDPYLAQLGKFANSQRTVPATLDWIDVAGLVANAHKGEGLGNRFLATVRECDAICHVVRMFEDGSASASSSLSSSATNVVHVNGKVNPQKDAEIVNLELVLADLDHVQRRLDKTSCTNQERQILERISQTLTNGIPARSIGLSPKEKKVIKSMGLLTLKPVLYAFNVDEIDFVLTDRNELEEDAKQVFESIEYTDLERDYRTIVCAKLEAELYGIMTNDEEDDNDDDAEEQSQNKPMEYLTSLGMEFDKDKQDGDNDESSINIDDMLSHTILPSIIQKMLHLSIAYTGPGVPPERSRTTRAHLFCNISNNDEDDDDTKNNMVARGDLTASGLAGKIHGDIQRGFIRAEVTPASKLLQYGNYADAKDDGCVRTEGRDYVLESNDVILIKWK